MPRRLHPEFIPLKSLQVPIKSCRAKTPIRAVNDKVTVLRKLRNMAATPKETDTKAAMIRLTVSICILNYSIYSILFRHSPIMSSERIQRPERDSANGTERLSFVAGSTIIEKELSFCLA
ncbi:hypothetical protein EBQ74_03925 [bacterium]|nr:hypothetical protein [bacterium]